MSLIFDLPPEIEQSLRAQSKNFEADAKEAMLVELYRQDKIGHHELALALGIDRFQVDVVLKRHNVTEDLPTMDEVDDELNALKKLGFN